VQTAELLVVQPLAELVTATGRDILQATVDLVEGELGLEVRGSSESQRCQL
jgi:DNA polymerase elongation subunit (family B)